MVTIPYLNMTPSQLSNYLKNQLTNIEPLLKRLTFKEGIAAFLEKREPRWEA